MTVLPILLATFVIVLSSPIYVDPETQVYKDEQGRDRFFHGFSNVIKVPPYFPNYTHWDNHDAFTEKDWKLWKEWGFNVNRLGTMWPGYEPDQKGDTHPEYLHTLKEIVDKTGKYGIYSLLDFHQDVYGPMVCGEGFPNWMTRTTTKWYNKFPVPLALPYEVDDKGIPLESLCEKLPWASHYVTVAAGHAFQALYDNEDGLQEHLGDYWEAIAKEFKDNDAVVGYELINEPWAGQIFSDPSLLWGGNADKKNLQPMYDYLNQRIRAIDDEHLIFFEPITFDFSWSPLGFTKVPGGESYQNRSSLSIHYYKPPNTKVDTHLRSRSKDMKRLKTGAMLTEFLTSLYINQSEYGDNVKDMEHVLDLCDTYKISWIGWCYKPGTIFNPDNTVNPVMLGTLSRTYAQAVAGKTLTMKFKNDTKLYVLEFEANEVTNKAETVIYLNEDIHYKEGFSVDISGDDSAKDLEVNQTEKNYITIRSKTQAVKIGANIKVTITAKKA